MPEQQKQELVLVAWLCDKHQSVCRHGLKALDLQPVGKAQDPGCSIKECKRKVHTYVAFSVLVDA